ncbi:MAG: inactive transglutaminase family protein [Rehaibacterium terrae]|uniref:inactive transglutaminase family protein n=1 Tax=Rehaibacterium terrae TaxID=1341696 RepID=UPI003918C652
MKKTHLYLLALAIASVALSAIVYKWKVLQFPLQPAADVEVWTLQARIEYQPRRGPNTVALQVPAETPGFAVIDEKFVARNYSRLEESHPDGREVQWAIRRAVGNQVLYYRATVVRAEPRGPVQFAFEPRLAEAPVLDGPKATAAQTLLDQVRDQSADIVTYARELVRRFNEVPASPEVAILAEDHVTPEAQARFLAQLLAVRNIPARVIHGLRLGSEDGRTALQPWLVVWTGTAWVTIDPRTAAEGFPRDLFLWTASERPILVVDGNPRASVEFSVSRNLADAMAVAERRLEVQNANLVKYSLLSLPLQTQEVYKVLLMVPVGAFIMLVLRNLVGVKTFGTFMPVLIALAFRDTGLVAGIVLFVLVVGAGLLVRFYLERLRLLLVPRLTAVLTVVVLLMAAVSVLANQLNIEVGLSVALFPMVIMAMTIERMSVAWEERGGGSAIKEGVGSLVVAALAYLVMNWDPLEHLLFVFPEFLLILFALSLVLGRYSGYRLSELLRFRALAREADPIVPPPGKG